MSVETVTYVPVMAPLRDWLRGQNVAGSVGADVYIGGVPTAAAFPAIELDRVGGFTEAPFERALIQFGCWGDPPGPAATVGAAATEQVAMALLSLLESTDRTALSGGVLYLGASGQSPLWAPDPASNQPRHLVTAEVTFQAA